MKEFSLEGIRTYELNLIPDERGFFAEAIRQDWSEFVDEWISQSNLSYSFPGIVRAWHRHNRGQIDYFLVLKGALKICAYDEKSRGLCVKSSAARRNHPLSESQGITITGQKPCPQNLH